MAQLTAAPLSALVDEPVHIRATGLTPFQLVCLRASLSDEKGNLFYSHAYYKASDTGEVDLEKDPSLGGDFVGVHPMGLFWSLKPETPLKRLMKRDVMNSPFQIQLKLCDPDVQVTNRDSSTLAASLTLERWYVAPGVTRIEVKEGRLRGALFLPPGGLCHVEFQSKHLIELLPKYAFDVTDKALATNSEATKEIYIVGLGKCSVGDNHFPGVIDLFGSGGGLIEFRAGLLASRGFVTLALAYWGYDDLPRQLRQVDIEYFEEAANFLLRHPKVLGPGVGILSICKGAEIGLSVAINLKQISATVLINGPNFVISNPHVYRGEITQPTPYSIELISSNALGFVAFHRVYEQTGDVDSQYFFPIEKAQGHFLFIVGEEDKNINSKSHAQQAIEQLRRNGKENWTLLSYPGAGHLIEPPYSPLCYASRIPYVHPKILWGGDVIPHAAAQEHSWKEIQKFLREHLIPRGTSQL